MKLKRLIFLIVGCIALALGSLGMALPILPTVPFFLVTLFCFSQSSQRLREWFVGTSMYKRHLRPFLDKKGMTARGKIAVLAGLTLVMGAGFVMMGRVPVGRAILAVVWFCHILYFALCVKTIRPEGNK